MTAGTITLTNNSDAVVGAGTAFLTDLTAGDFIVANVGGIAYTLPVKSVASNTSLTIASKFSGPTMSGLAWSATTRNQQALVTASMVAQNTEALRGLNYDKQNWQAVFSSAGDIIVTLPDNSQFTGPSWKKLASNLGAVTISGPYTIITSPDGSRRLVLPDDGSGSLIYQTGEGVNLAIEVGAGGTGATTSANARVNLQLDRLSQEFTSETRLWSDSAKSNHRLTLQNDGTWGVYSESQGTWKPLSIFQGGTGVKSYPELNRAIQSPWLDPNDPRVLEYIAWDATVAWPELMVRIGPLYIDVVGVIRKDATSNSSQTLFRVLKALPGFASMYAPFSPSSSGKIGAEIVATHSSLLTVGTGRVVVSTLGLASAYTVVNIKLIGV